MEERLIRAYDHVKSLTKQYGTSYYFATRFFPKKMRLATYALYGFFRVPDEYVDNPDQSLSHQEVIQKLEDWHEKWRQAHQTGDSDDPVLLVTAKTFQEYDIPYQYGEDFLAAMKQDLSKERYETYAELQGYMYGSASVVGLMMSHVIGFEDGALPYAEKLGEAMQMTNFLRDIREDYEDRNRIYMPAEDLAKLGVTEDHIRNHICDDKFIEFMKFEIQRTRALYREADQGIPMLTPRGRFAVRMASRLYEAILTKIEEQNYNIFIGRARTTKREKMKILASELVKK